VKLHDLEAEFVARLTERSWGDVATLQEAGGIKFLCPKCFDANGGPIGTHLIIVWFEGKPVPEGTYKADPRWGVTGTSLHDLTLSPSINVIGGCGWHGWVKNGVAK
jgi:hypothetical protein